MKKIGLALSGGGFRASLYHLGVVRFLRDAGILPQVTHITAVSGGSILAAHLVLNWDRYNGAPSEFNAAAAELLAFVRLDVRNRILRRFPLALPLRGPRRLLGLSNRKLTRTGLLEYHYEQYLFGDTSLFELPEKPQLHLLSTNLSEGCLVSFNRNGLLMVRRQADNTMRLDPIHAGLATVAMAVTASSAFPGFFPPAELTGTAVGANSGEFGRQAYTDGGVFDNLGVRMFRCLQRSLLLDSPLSCHDFVDYPAVVEALRAAAREHNESPLQRLTQILLAGCTRPDLIMLADDGTAAGTGDRPEAGPGSGGQPRPAPGAGNGDGADPLVAGLEGVLRHFQFYNEPLFSHLKLHDHEAESLLQASRFGGRALTPADQLWLNRHLLDAAFRPVLGRDCFHRLNSGLDCVLVSDVGKRIEVQGQGRAGGLIRTALRATDILMDRVWQLENETFHGMPGFVFAPITDVIEPAEDPTAPHPEIQRQVAQIRTDLDRFSPLEISSLVRHGYCVGRRTCKAHPELFGADLPATPPWDPIPGPQGVETPPEAPRLERGPTAVPAPVTARARTLQRSAARRIWTTLLDYRDWTSYVYVPLIIPILVLAPYFIVKSFQRSHRINHLMEAFTQKSRDVELMSRLLENGPEERWIGEAPEEVGKLDEPDLKGFEVIQDSWITDLRNWKPGPAARSDPSSSIHHYRRLKVAKRPGQGGNDLFRWHLLAQDPKAEFRFPNQQLQPTLRRSNLVGGTAAGEKASHWEVSYDFKNIQDGEFVDLLIEYHSSGRFLQSGTNSTSVPLNILTDTAELTTWILMPQGKDYSHFRIVKYEKGKREKVEPVRVVTEYLATDYTILAFKLLSLKGGYTYEVNWNYK
jgi:predicted acylesterase/phospholipase RssA